MTQLILFKCDAPGCNREVNEEGELRVLERTTFGRGAVNVERRHSCSAACEAVVLRESAWRLLAAPSETGSYRDAAKADGARERYVTPEGFTLLPSAMLRDLSIEEGGVVWFTKVAGRWAAFKDGESMYEIPVHAEACGTEYRGCAPDCPKDRAEQAAHAAEKVAEERGWYVLPGKRGFDGAGWFETREAAVEGLERDVLGPFPTMHKARQAREMVCPVLAPSALSDLLRLAGRHVPAAVVKTWSVADQHEAEAWAAFTLSDAQRGVRRAPPEPAWVREGAVIRLHPWEVNPPTYEQACERQWATREREKGESVEMKVERDTLRDQKRENDATIERLQTELRRQRNELLAELNEVRADREQWTTAAQAADRAAKQLSSERDVLREENVRLAKDLTKLREEYEKEMMNKYGLISENVRNLALERDRLRVERDLYANTIRVHTLGEPVPVVLHCPACGTQHVDAPDPEKGWTGPPHRSHLCASCGCIWRAADVPTRGVAAPSTRGTDDTWPNPRGDGPGWYVSGSSIGWFTSRTRAVPRLYAGEVRGPFPNAVEARSMTSETDEDRDRIALDIEAAEDLIARSTYREVPSRVIRSWSRDDLIEAVTWAAYDSGEDYHCKIRLVRDIGPCPPAPKHVEQAHRAQLAEYAAQAAKRGSQPC